MFDHHPGLSPGIQPPFDLEMPAGAQTAWELIAGAIMIYTLYYFVQRIRIEKSAFPAFFWLGTLVLMFAEPLFDVAMTCYYPHEGMNGTFELWGRIMPLFLVFCYVGGIARVMYGVALVIEEGVQPSFIWKAFAIMGVGTAIYEVITINLGLWTYYSPVHPIRVLNYPLGIGIPNGAAFLLSALAVVKLRPLIEAESKPWLATLILPIVFVMGEFAVGWPYFSAINTEAGIDNPLIGIAGLATTLIFALALVWWVTLVGTQRSPAKRAGKTEAAVA